MTFQTFIHYLSTLGQTLLRFTGYGAGITAGIGMVYIAIITRIGENTPVNNERYIEVIINFAFLGAVIGGIIGLIYWIYALRKK